MKPKLRWHIAERFGVAFVVIVPIVLDGKLHETFLLAQGCTKFFSAPLVVDAALVERRVVGEELDEVILSICVEEAPSQS